MRAGFRGGLLVALLIGSGLAMGSCSGNRGSDDQAAGDTLTRRQKDSIISTLPLPGAGAVGKALDAADAAKARAAVLDTLQ